MNNLKKILGISALALGLLNGCKEYITEYSDVKHEDAIVSYKNYRSGYNTTMLMPISTGKTTMFFPITTFHPAGYNITFDGKIQFELDNKKMFDKFNSNDQADVSYKEKYKLTYEDTNNDGIDELIGKNFMDAEFIDAQPITDRILDRF